MWPRLVIARECFYLFCDQAPGEKMIIIADRVILSTIYKPRELLMEGFVLEHRQEPGEEGSQRLAPGDQGNPQ